MVNYLVKFFLFSLPVFGFLAFFFYWPLTMIIQLGITTDSSNWIKIFTNPLFSKFLWFTLLQALITVFGSLLIGLPSGYLLARGKPYFGTILRSAITVPFLFPPLALLLGFITLFGSQGYINVFLGDLIALDPYSFWGIVTLHTLYNISVVARISESAFRSESADLHHVAKTFGK